MPLSYLQDLPKCYELHYFYHLQPEQLTFAWPEGRAAYIDIIDTWEMTVDQVSQPFVGTFSLELPVRPGLAVRIRDSRTDHRTRR